jgi:hypothetical protein
MMITFLQEDGPERGVDIRRAGERSERAGSRPGARARLLRPACSEGDAIDFLVSICKLGGRVLPSLDDGFLPPVEVSL